MIENNQNCVCLSTRIKRYSESQRAICQLQAYTCIHDSLMNLTRNVYMLYIICVYRAYMTHVRVKDRGSRRKTRTQGTETHTN